MEKTINKKILNIITLLILILVPFLKFFSMNLESFGILNNYDNINPAIVLYVSVPFLLFIYIKDIIIKKRKLDIFDYLFYILIITGIIPVILSIDKSYAILGKEFRHEGFLSVLSYYLLFINWKINGTKEDIKKFIKLLVVIALLNSVYALLQIYTNFNFIIRFDLDPMMASGLCGNPNFFGSYIVTVISIITYIFMINKKTSIKDILIIILLFISLINCQSTGPFLTYILFLFLMIIYLLVKRNFKLKNFLIVLIVLILTYSGVYLINKYQIKSYRCEMCDLKNSVIKDNKKESSTDNIDVTNGRLEIWKNSIDIFVKYPIIGVGFDNYELAYPNPKVTNSFTFALTTNNEIKKETPITYYVVDNAHNVYLHTLISTGILGLVPYLILCLLTFIKGLKSKNKLETILLAGFVSYSIQAFANISVIQVAPIYYIIIGLMLSIKHEHI